MTTDSATFQTADAAAPAGHAPVAKENLLGICNAIGEDLGFDPLFLRVPLAALLLWNPVAILAAYGALGVVVLATRLLFPRKVRRTAPAEAQAASAAAMVEQPIEYARAA